MKKQTKGSAKSGITGKDNYNTALKVNQTPLFALILISLSLIIVASNTLHAASFDSPAAVNDSASAMYTVDDIYNRLNTGTAGTKRTTSFSEPTSAPGAQGHDLNEVMSVAPSVDNSNGATTTDVLAGKTYWGLKSGQWGPQTGTAVGIASGNATDGEVLSGKTYSNASGSSTGTMTNVGAQIITPANTEKTITQGYHDGTGKVVTDANLTAANIKNGISIFGVSGTYTGIGSNYPAEVPKTGQNLCYKTDGTSGTIACSGTAQDGELQKGVSHASPRFTDNSDGTVTDNSTGLMWLKNANCANAARNWATAFSDISSLNTNGAMNSNDCSDTSNGGSHQTDWRLPNVKELQSLIDFQNTSPALSTGHPFSSVFSNGYWSSTTVADVTGNAWNVYLYDGYVGNDNKTDTNYVWPVRGGQ